MKIKILVYKKDLGGKENECKTTDRSRDNCDEIVKNANEGYGKEWKPQTVSTYLAKLCLKNYIQMKRAGRTITYEILITEEDYKSEQAREFVAFWNNGSLKQFITAFYKDEPASKDEIEELRNAIEELEE